MADREELLRLAERATRISGEVRHRDKGDGEERYDVLGSPCGFPVATFGDGNDALFFIAAHQFAASLRARAQDPLRAHGGEE